MRYIVSGGGTGGHIYPALAIADEIAKRDSEAEILYVGTPNGLEKELATLAGLPYKTVRVKGLPRRLNMDSLKSGIELLKGLGDANSILKNFKPDVVIGTGGYVCGPILFQAARKGIVTMIQEQNAFPGKTNKILGRRVDSIAIAFEEAKKYFKNPEKCFISGNPLREEFKHLDREKAFAETGLNRNTKIVVSFGGSGGQESINQSILEAIDAFGNEDVQLVHITGKNHYDKFMNEVGDIPENIRIMSYSHEIPSLLSIADLAIVSSSAMTLAEISAVGLPSILIPKAYTAENHQEYNARAYESKGASVVILEKDLNGEALFDEVMKIVGDESILESMGENSKSIAKLNATESIVDEVERLIASSRG